MCSINPTTWLKLTTIGPELPDDKVNRRSFNLNVSNFETFELRNFDLRTSTIAHDFRTFRNNLLYSKVDCRSGESWPATCFVWRNGAIDKSWYMNGRRHRGPVNGFDMPAVLMVDGTHGSSRDSTQEWHVNGKRHRESVDGIEQPAIVWVNGYQSWWVNGHMTNMVYT